jgi:hypothetical protein
MKPAKKRDLSQLRTQILAEIAQHPLTLLPFGTAILGAAWTFAFNPQPASVIAMVGGAALAVVGATYNLMFNGSVIRDRILAKWEREADEEENLTKQELRHELLRTRGTDDILRLYDRMEGIMEDSRQALQGATVSEIKRLQFQPIIDQNVDSAITLFNRLAYLQKRLSNLLNSTGQHDAEFSRKLAELRGQRQKMIDHVTQTMEALEKLNAELPQLGDEELETAQRNLGQLRDSLDLARTAYQRLKDEIRPISGIHAKPAEFKEGEGKEQERQ